jgi:Holliday junction resolvase RusA-like endonuclease
VTVQFMAYGIPQPKGSTKGFVVRGKNGKPRAAITSDNTRLKPWADVVRHEAQRAAGAFFAGPGVPVIVSVHFRLPRPKSTPRHVTHQTKKPDLDKLVRGILDALTGVLFADDSQVVEIATSKAFADGPPWAMVRVEEAL